MNTLSTEKKIQILKILVEGNSIRSTERLTGVHRDTIMRLLVKVGKRCQEIMDEKLKDFHCKRIEADEIWCYVGKKEKVLKKSKKYDSTLGDQFVFVALDSDSKLVPVFTVGKRDQITTQKFVKQLQEKLKNNGRIQLTTDGFPGYPIAVEEAFGGEIDFAQLIKIYSGNDEISEKRYSPPRIKEVISKIINGDPDVKKICTSYVERQNLTIRMQLRRFTRLTNAFSKKLENLKAALYLHFAHYNFMRIHQSLKVTPAMEAGITGHVWEWEEIL